jgi:hypothetical protein
MDLDEGISWIWMMVIQGLDQMFFNGRPDGSEGFSRLGFGVFPFFQRSASILSKARRPFCNPKIRLFSIYSSTC